MPKMMWLISGPTPHTSWHLCLPGEGSRPRLSGCCSGACRWDPQGKGQWDGTESPRAHLWTSLASVSPFVGRGAFRLRFKSKCNLAQEASTPRPRTRVGATRQVWAPPWSDAAPAAHAASLRPAARLPPLSSAALHALSVHVALGTGDTVTGLSVKVGPLQACALLLLAPPPPWCPAHGQRLPRGFWSAFLLPGLLSRDAGRGAEGQSRRRNSPCDGPGRESVGFAPGKTPAPARAQARRADAVSSEAREHEGARRRGRRRWAGSVLRVGGRGANYCPRPNLAHTCFCIIRKLEDRFTFF